MGSDGAGERAGASLPSPRGGDSNSIELVWIDLDKQDNAQVIFETLNDRGAPLNAIDLVKNFVFQHEPGSSDAENLCELHWVWKRTTGGRRRSASVVSTGCKSFTKMFEANSPDVSSLIPDFAEDARIYRSFSELPAGTRKRRFFDRLEVLSTTTPFPLLLFLFRKDVLPADGLDRCLDLIEDYLVRRMLVRGTAQGYNRLFTEPSRTCGGTPAIATR